MPDIYYVDGRFVEAAQAVLPLNDLGILRGYGVFDFMRTYGGRPIFILDHLRRLRRSADQVGLNLPWGEAELVARVHETLERNRHPESGIRLLVTGGPSADFITPQDRPRLVIMVTALKSLPEEIYRHGAAVITVLYGRSLPAAKSTDYTRAIMVLADARRKAAIEAIYIDAEGRIREGTTSNIFAIVNGRLVTPGEGILDGITRAKTIQLAEKFLPVDLRPLRREELIGAEEVFITSSSRMIVPIVRVDSQRIGAGSPGGHTRALMQAFQAYTQQLSIAPQTAPR